MVANHLRDKSRRPETRSLESLPTLGLSNPSPEEMVIKAEQLRQVQACVGELSEQQQEVLSLKFGAGLSYKEMGKAMKITPTYVGVLLHRAVRDLREALEKKGEIE
jgi:RNA polymerase sigma-70 factor (ECF subfamily)